MKKDSPEERPEPLEKITRPPSIWAMFWVASLHVGFILLVFLIFVTKDEYHSRRTEGLARLTTCEQGIARNNERIARLEVLVGN